jgi:hypothetical protein
VYFEGCRMMFGKESSANFSRHDKKKELSNFLRYNKYSVKKALKDSKKCILHDLAKSLII